MKPVLAVMATLIGGMTAMALPPRLTQTNLFQQVNKSIPDGDADGIADIHTITSDIAHITSIRLSLKISGNFNGDLYGYLTHNGGLTVLLNRPGKTAANAFGYNDCGLDVTFDDAAGNDIHDYHLVTIPARGSPLTGTWQPDARFEDPYLSNSLFPRSAFLSEFNGLNAAGDWVLFLADMDSGGTNFLNSWELEISGTPLIAPTVLWTNPADVVYGTALDGNQLNATANVAGTFVYAPPPGTILPAGTTQPLTVTFWPDDTNQYQTLTLAVSLNVAAAFLNVTADDQVRTYGAANPELTGHVSGVQNGDNITVNYTTEAASSSPVGTYQIVPNLNDPDGKLANYSLSVSPATLRVQPALVLVQAQNAIRVYGQTNPPLNATIIGLVNGEDTNVLEGMLELNTSADVNSPVGTYAIEPWGLSATNYTLSFSNGTLSVSAAQLTVTAADQVRTYGAPNPELTGQVSGVQDADNITVAYATAATASSPVGSYQIVPNLNDPDGKLTNYSLNLSVGTLTVSPAQLIVTADDQARTYGALNPELTGQVSGVQNEDNITVTYATEATASSPVGSYPIVPDVNDPDDKLANYSLSVSPVMLRVQPALVLVQAQNAIRVYGQTNPPLNATITGLVNGEDTDVLEGTLELNTLADVNSPVGTYAIEPWGLSATNYTLSFSNGTLSVSAAQLTVTAADQVWTYGAPNPELTGQVSGVQNGDNITVSYAVEAAASSPVGIYQIAPTINDPDGKLINYQISSAPGTLTITKASTTGTVTSSANPALPGALITFTITLSSQQPSSAVPDGAIQTTVDGAVYGTPVTLTGGLAVVTTDQLAAGNHTVTVEYSGNSNFLGTTMSLEPVQVVNAPPPTLTLLTDGPGQYRVALSGMPRTTYWIQWTENLDDTNWRLLNIATTDSSGYLEMPDSPPQDSISRFYRSMSPTQDSSNLFAAQITSSANPALPGFPVTFSVTLEPATRNANEATGSVQFNIDGVPYGPLVPLVAGAASVTANDLCLGKHLVSVEFGASPTLAWPTNTLSRTQLIDTAPVGGEALLVRNASGGTKTLVSDLLANAFDPDGDLLTLRSYEPQSAQGGSVTIANGWLYYTPPIGNTNTDSFHYTVTDCWGASASGIARIGFTLDKQPAPDQTRLDLGNGAYGIIFWAIPWRQYAVEYAIDAADPQWQFLTAQTADSAGHIEIKGALAEEAATRLYRLVCPLDDVGASPFRLAVWTNFVAQTNGRTTVMWSERSHPPDWPDSPPVLTWNTNCLLYGMDGFTAISQCNQFEGAPGQVPVTLLTRRHAYVRGHGLGANGLWTNALTGQKVWFCTPSNIVVEMSIAANFTRAGIFDDKSYDYGIIAFTEDVPDSLTPMSVLGSTDFQVYYYQTDDIPFLWLGTEQDGHIATDSTIPGFSYPLFKGGDSGSPNIILAPDNKLLFFGGRSTSGPSAQMQADIDALSVCLCLSTNDYQLRWYDVTPWAP